MVFRFRISPRYKYTVFILYIIVGIIIFEIRFPSTGLVFALYTLYGLLGLKILLDWNKTVSLDTTRGILEIGKKKFTLREIESVELGFFGLSVIVRTRNGVEIFPYPLEDAEDFLRIFEDMKYSSEVKL